MEEEHCENTTSSPYVCICMQCGSRHVFKMDKSLYSKNKSWSMVNASAVRCCISQWESAVDNMNDMEFNLESLSPTSITKSESTCHPIQTNESNYSMCSYVTTSNNNDSMSMNFVAEEEDVFDSKFEFESVTPLNASQMSFDSMDDSWEGGYVTSMSESPSEYAQQVFEYESSALLIEEEGAGSMDDVTLSASPPTGTGISDSKTLQDSKLPSPTSVSSLDTAICKLQPMLMKSIKDFCHSRVETTMRRQFSDNLDQSCKSHSSIYQDGSISGAPIPITFHDVKFGLVVGAVDCNVAPNPVTREFLLPLSDYLLDYFLCYQASIRSVANKTKCEIELTRRVLNRRICSQSWLKYVVIRISGLSYKLIEMCDKGLHKFLPRYSERILYSKPSQLTLFVKEETPDNSNLYFNYQRTGAVLPEYGNLKCQSQFTRSNSSKLVWRDRRQECGKFEFSSGSKFVYPNTGGQTSQSIASKILIGPSTLEELYEIKERNLRMRHENMNRFRRHIIPVYY